MLTEPAHCRPWEQIPENELTVIVTTKQLQTSSHSHLNQVQNVELSLASPNDQTEEHGTKDKKEHSFNGQKSPSLSPQKKRLCVNTSLNLSSHAKESKHAKLSLNPGKENLTCDNTGGYCPPEEVKRAKEKRDARCKETSKTTSKQNITTQSKNQVSFPARTQNWLTEWSVYCKTKCGDKNSALAGNECESTATETLTGEDPSADDLQPPQVCNLTCSCALVIQINRWTLSESE